jgi:hypothetical protein
MPETRNNDVPSDSRSLQSTSNSQTPWHIYALMQRIDIDPSSLTGWLQETLHQAENISEETSAKLSESDIKERFQNYKEKFHTEFGPDDYFYFDELVIHLEDPDHQNVAAWQDCQKFVQDMEDLIQLANARAAKYIAILGKSEAQMKHEKELALEERFRGLIVEESSMLFWDSLVRIQFNTQVRLGICNSSGISGSNGGNGDGDSSRASSVELETPDQSQNTVDGTVFTA